MSDQTIESAPPVEPVKRARAVKAPEPATPSNLVAVTKGGEVIEVNPAALADHISLGWVAV